MTLAELPLRLLPPQVVTARRPQRMLERMWVVNRAGGWTIVVTGLSVSVFTLWSNGWPQPGFFVSTRVTPLAVTNTAVLPPPPRKTNRLSFTFSTVMLSADG